MARITLIALTLLLTRALHAQDLIVTTSGDSIHCTITSVGPYRLFYRRSTAGGNDHDNIALKKVAYYKRVGYFPVVLGNADGGDPVLAAGNKWMMTVGVGWAYRTAPIEEGTTPQQEDYLNGLRLGYHACGSLHLFLSEHAAIGISYSSFFGARNSTEVTVLLPDSSTISGRMAEDVRLIWVGLNALVRSDWSGRFRINGSLGIGPLFYRNHATLIDDYIISGTSFAAKVALGTDYRLSDALSIGVEVGFMHGRVGEFSVDTGTSTYVVNLPEKTKESVDRLDAGFTFRVRL